jgi:hypothetical protein
MVQRPHCNNEKDETIESDTDIMLANNADFCLDDLC